MTNSNRYLRIHDFDRHLQVYALWIPIQMYMVRPCLVGFYIAIPDTCIIWDGEREGGGGGGGRRGEGEGRGGGEVPQAPQRTLASLGILYTVLQYSNHIETS